MALDVQVKVPSKCKQYMGVYACMDVAAGPKSAATAANALFPAQRRVARVRVVICHN